MLDGGKAAFLILLDLSAAFDTVDHNILLHVLNSKYHVTGTALDWFQSYLGGRSFRVRLGNKYSKSHPLTTGVPQGSVLGPILFNILSSGLASIFEDYNISFYCYADDTQFFVTFDPKSRESEGAARELISTVFNKLAEWMLEHHLKLNEEKTQFLPISRDINRDFSPLLIGDISLPPAHTVRNLGFVFNRALSISDQIKSLRQNAFFHLKRIRSVRNCISFVNREILTHAFVTSRLDFCNSLLFGSTTVTLKGIKSILNATAKSLTGAHPMLSSTAVLFRLHWLPVEARISFKLSILGYKILHKQAPQYFSKITISSNIRDTRSSMAPLLTSELYLTTTRLKRYGDRSCFSAICKTFNSLPPEIRAEKNFSRFKCLLKRHFFILSFKEFFND